MERKTTRILLGYSKENIYNLDETGYFWNTLPDHGFVQKVRKCKGGKKVRQDSP